MTYRTTWTDEQNADAKALWLDGVEARVIGERVGKTRSAVIGRADRKLWGPHPQAKTVGAKWRRIPAGPAVLSGYARGLHA